MTTNDEMQQIATAVGNRLTAFEGVDGFLVVVIRRPTATEDGASGGAVGGTIPAHIIAATAREVLAAAVLAARDSPDAQRG